MNKNLYIIGLSAGLLAGCTLTPAPDTVVQEIAVRAALTGPVTVQVESDADRAALKAGEDQGASRPVVTEAPPTEPAVGRGPLLGAVTITAPHTLEGTWKLTGPTKVTIGFSGDGTYGDVRQVLCRIDQTDGRLVGTCIPGRKQMRGSLEGDKLQLDWSSGLVSVKLDGMMLSGSSFKGELRLGALGIPLTNGMPYFGHKLVAGVTPPPATDAVAAEVIGDLANDRPVTDRYSAAGLAALKDTPPLPERDRRELGASSSVVFVDEVVIPPDDTKPEQRMAVYDVEFDKGWRLCGVVVNDAGKVDQVDCR